MRNTGCEKMRFSHFLVAFVLRLALLVMGVDVCATPERRTYTRVMVFGGMCGKRKERG